MKNARWTETARNDLSAIDDAYPGAPEFVDEVGDTALAACTFLIENPFAGSVVKTKFAGSSARKWRVGKTPYLLLYRVCDDAIEILRLMHARADWKDGA